RSNPRYTSFGVLFFCIYVCFCRFPFMYETLSAKHFERLLTQFVRLDSAAIRAMCGEAAITHGCL
ncbi:MAG: hypothetical protein LBV16_01730, partial [Elusimicrobiota bacterium]|nr:hypothetical protein [Elusimicrobiota bacterium]